MDAYAVDYNEYSIPIIFLLIVFIVIWIILIVKKEVLESKVESIAQLGMSFIVLIVVIMISYHRVKKPLLIDLLSLCENADANEESVVNVDNPFYTILSFLYYYIRIYVQSVITLIIIIAVVYVLYMLTTVQINKPIAFDTYWQLRYAFFHFILLGVEILSCYIFGGKDVINDADRNGLLYLKEIRDSIKPSYLMQIISPNNLHTHYVPFGTGLLASIFYAGIMLGKWKKEDICTKKDEFVYRFLTGIFCIVTITIVMYVIQFAYSALNMGNRK